MGIPRDIIQEQPGLGDWSILMGYRGSIAHGTYIPANNPDSIDDKDVMSVCVPPIEYYMGLRQYGSKGTKEIKRQNGKILWDIVVYEAKKFISLLEKGNPNVLMMLWLEPNYYIKVTGAGQTLIDYRDFFACKHVYHSFCGYARGQLHRMTHHAFQGHMGAKRKELVERYGYDTKNSSHLIRLLRMGYEFLIDGELHVLREDATQLLEIKRGEWTLEQVQAEADKWFDKVEDAYLNSTLPDRPDRDAVNRLAVSVIGQALHERGEL